MAAAGQAFGLGPVCDRYYFFAVSVVLHLSTRSYPNCIVSCSIALFNTSVLSWFAADFLRRFQTTRLRFSFLLYQSAMTKLFIWLRSMDTWRNMQTSLVHDRICVSVISEWVSRGLTSHSTLYRSFWGQFLQVSEVIWPNQQCQSTEGSQLTTEIP